MTTPELPLADRHMKRMLRHRALGETEHAKFHGNTADLLRRQHAALVEASYALDSVLHPLDDEERTQPEYQGCQAAANAVNTAIQAAEGKS